MTDTSKQPLEPTASGPVNIGSLPVSSILGGEKMTARDTLYHAWLYLYADAQGAPLRSQLYRDLSAALEIIFKAHSAIPIRS